jgi:integrase
MSVRVPPYCRQRESGRPDRAYCRIDGKKVWLGCYGSPESKTKYAELISQAGIASSDTSPPAPPTEPTVTELMAAYLDHVDEYYGHKSAEWYHARSFMKLLRKHYGSLPAHEFKAKKLKQLRELWVAEDWSRKYVNEHVARLKRMFKWATSEEMVPTDVYQSLDSVVGLRKGKCKAHDYDPIKPVSDADVKKTLKFLSEQVTTMVQVQRYCGCRPGELTKIRKKDIDRSGKVWVVKLKKHKTLHHGKQRFILFGPRAQMLLLPRLVCADNDFVFPIRRDSYRTAVQRAAVKAGVESWFPNQLRHSAGTEAREEMGLEAAQVHLGHARADVTQIYAETSLEKAKEVALRIG